MPYIAVVVGGLAAQGLRATRRSRCATSAASIESDWDSINLNEPNITSNGFLNEFRLAQANLQANIAAGRGATFAYTGARHVDPLPIFLAHFNAQNAANAGNAAVYTGANWTNATFLGFLAARNPNPWGFATAGTSGLIGNADVPQQRGRRPGLPVNFFVANPDLLGAGTTAGAAQLTTNGGGTRAHSMQFEYRKRFSNSFSVNTSYTFSLAEMQQRFGFTRPMEWVDQAGQVGNVRHAAEGELAARDSGRQGSQVRRRHERLPGRRSSAAGRWTASAASRPARRSTSATCAWSA